MMNFLSPLHRGVRFESVHWQASKELPEVRFAVREPSLQKRIELTRQLHELTYETSSWQAARKWSNWSWP